MVTLFYTKIHNEFFIFLGVALHYTIYHTKNNKPYLEAHHLKWLSKGGTDTIDNVVALCPNCHRKMHELNDKDDIKKLKMVLDEYNKIIDY